MYKLICHHSEHTTFAYLWSVNDDLWNVSDYSWSVSDYLSSVSCIWIVIQFIVTSQMATTANILLSAHCNTLKHTATHCNTLKHTETHCNTLQHTLQIATAANILHSVASWLWRNFAWEISQAKFLKTRLSPYVVN